MERLKTGLALLAVVIIAAGLWMTRSASRTLARIQRTESIRIGYAVEPPYVFLDNRGEPTGCEIEVAKVLLSRLGVRRIEWCQTRFGNLIPELLDGRFDVVVAGMFITPERALRVSFSDPTLHVRPALLVRSGNPRNLHAYEDTLRESHPPTKLAALQGSVEEALLQQLGVPKAQWVLVPDARTGMSALESGLVDGLALSAPTLRFLAQQAQHGLTEIAQPFDIPASAKRLPDGYPACVFRKRDGDLRNLWNRQLRAFIGTPEHRRILASFGFSDEELPGNLTMDDILKPEAP